MRYPTINLVLATASGVRRTSDPIAIRVVMPCTDESAMKRARHGRTREGADSRARNRSPAGSEHSPEGPQRVQGGRNPLGLDECDAPIDEGLSLTA
jgi:hypothetical protein